MTKKDIDYLDIVYINPVILLYKRQVISYLKVLQIVHFELLYYSRCLIFAKLFVHNPVSNTSFGKILYGPDLYIPMPFYTDSENYLKLIQNNLNEKLPGLNTNEFESKSTAVLKEYVFNNLKKDKFSLFENIVNLLNKI
jgi:hypothetical protein